LFEVSDHPFLSTVNSSQQFYNLTKICFLQGKLYRKIPFVCQLVILLCQCAMAGNQPGNFVIG